MVQGNQSLAPRIQRSNTHVLASIAHRLNTFKAMRLCAPMFGSCRERRNRVIQFGICQFDDNPYVVGRKAGVSLKVQFKTVSGRHASLWVQDGQLHLKDHGSTNGTFVNGARVTDEVQIGEEDLIHFAEAPFRVRRQSPTGQNRWYDCPQCL